MPNINLDACPNFSGGAHDNSDLSFVPWQLHGAHLFGLSKLGSTFNGKSSEKNPCTWERNPAWVKLTEEQKEAKRNHGEKIESYYLGWGEWEGGVKPHSKDRYGVCLTRSKLFVLDIDTHEADGNKNFADWLQELGIPNDFQTFTVATGTGGFHYYFQIPRVFQDTQISKMTNLLPGVDVFPSGQYVVGPGTSRTMADGSIAHYEVSRNLPIAEMPEALADALVEKLRAAGKIVDPEELARQEEQRRQAEARRQHRREHPEQYDATALSEGQGRMVNQLLSEMSSLAEGTRHDGIFQLSHSIGKMTGWDHEDEILPQVIEAALLSGHSPCAEKDARSGYTKGAGLWVDYREQNRLQRELERKTTTSKKDQKTMTGTATEETDKKELPPLHSEFFNDVNVARAYADTRGDELISVDEWNAWASFVRESGHWAKTKPAVVDSHLMDWVADDVYPALKQQLRDEAEKVKDDAAKSEEQEKRAAKLVAKASRYLNLPSCHNAAKALYGRVMRSSSIFDANGDLMLSPSGAIELADGSQRPATPSDYFVKRCGAEYVPGAKSELWDEILSAFPPNVLPYLQVIIGQALTGYQPSDASIFFFSGGGSNGKSTFLDVICAIMGDYADTPDSSILSAGGADSFSRSIFKGLRMALLEETAEGQWLDDKIVKKLAGTDKMRGAKKFQDEETFEVITTILITTNDLPQVSANDDGTWRRLKLLPMPYKFVPAHQYDPATAPEHHRPRNPKLTRAKNNPEILQAALAWAVEGARIWFENSQEELPIPIEMEEAQKGWRLRQDKIGYWWSDWIVADPDSYILPQDAYETFKLSAKDSGREAGSKQKFLAALTSHSLFQSAKAEYVTQQRPPKRGHSGYIPEKQSNSPYEREPVAADPRNARSFISGIRFTTPEDLPKDDAEL